MGGFLKGDKVYVATAELGYQTDTLDLDRNATVVKRRPYRHVTEASVRQVLPSFQGRIMQKPPMYSALRKDGRRLYKLAREEGLDESDVKIDARPVEVKSIDLTRFDSPTFSLTLQVGGGTYVRSLCRDIGEAVGSAATMTSLVRTKHGPFEIQDCMEYDDLKTSDAATIYAHILATNRKFNITL
jgi:tRNA pseudouridine55 synthase